PDDQALAGCGDYSAGAVRSGAGALPAGVREGFAGFDHQDGYGRGDRGGCTGAGGAAAGGVQGAGAASEGASDGDFRGGEVGSAAGRAGLPVMSAPLWVGRRARSHSWADAALRVAARYERLDYGSRPTFVTPARAHISWTRTTAS